MQTLTIKTERIATLLEDLLWSERNKIEKELKVRKYSSLEQVEEAQRDFKEIEELWSLTDSLKRNFSKEESA